MNSIIIHGHNLKVEKSHDEMAPVDRSDTVVVSGEIMRSPSDGYHTFDELYEHRHALFIALCKQVDDCTFIDSTNGEPHVCDWKVWRSKRHSDGSEIEGWFVMGIGRKAGEQMTYHLPNRLWDETDFAEEVVNAPEFDGHTSQDVIERLKKL